MAPVRIRACVTHSQLSYQPEKSAHCQAGLVIKQISRERACVVFGANEREFSALINKAPRKIQSAIE